MHLSSQKFLVLTGAILGGAVSLFPNQPATAQFASLMPQMLLAQVEAPEIEDPEVEAEVEAPEVEADIETPDVETPDVDPAEPESPAAETPQGPTLVELAASSDAFDTLVQALQTAELVDTLSGEGPYTVFAPTDEAFAALPDGTVEALLQPENRPLLVDILTYHVVEGEVPSSAVTSGSVPTLSEDALTVEVGDTITVDGATVIQPDAQASNGIIHVIDAVLVPESAMSDVQALLESVSVEQAAEPEATQTSSTESSSSTTTTTTTPSAASSEPVRGLW
ncbi:MAG: fasciclin domain-containing protein [Elainellaceae cyanobacterium]